MSEKKKEETVVVDQQALNAPPTPDGDQSSPPSEDETTPLEDTDLLPTPEGKVRLPGVTGHERPETAKARRQVVSPVAQTEKLTRVKALPPSAPESKRFDWRFLPLYLGMVAILALLLVRQCSGNGGVSDDVVSAISVDGDKTRAMLASDGPIVTAIKTDGDETRKAVGPDGKLYKLLKRFQEMVITDDDEMADATTELNRKGGKDCCEVNMPPIGMLNSMNSLLVETNDQSAANGRAIARLDRKVDSYEELARKRAEVTNNYLLALEAKYGDLSVGVDELRSRSERPVNVRVMVPRTKTVAVER